MDQNGDCQPDTPVTPVDPKPVTPVTPVDPVDEEKNEPEKPDPRCGSNLERFDEKNQQCVCKLGY